MHVVLAKKNWTNWYDSRAPDSNLGDDGANSLTAKERTVFRLNLGNIFVPASLGCVEVLRHLVDVREMDPNALLDGSEEGRPALYPMHLALVQPNGDVLRYLISRDKTRRRRRRNSSKGSAAADERSSAMAEGQLHHAVADDRVSLRNFLLLLSHPGVATDARDSRGNTLLHFACQCHVRSDVEAEQLNAMAKAKARLLIDAGADPHPTNYGGVSPWDAMQFHWEKGGRSERDAREAVWEFQRFVRVDSDDAS